MSLFRDNRKSALEVQFGKYWLQKGRVPEPSAIATMANAIEEELPNWINADLITESIASLRASSKALPELSSIIAEAKYITSSRLKRLPPPAAPAKEDELDLWTDLAAHRILTTRQKVKDAPGVCDPCPWILATVKQPPTELERQGFLRMFSRVRKADQNGLADYWGDNNPYGFSADQIKASFTASQDACAVGLVWE